MPLHVPTSSQWVTFPINPTDKVLVSWQDETIQRSNTYYVSKCYWGYLKNPGTQRSNFTEFKPEDHQDWFIEGPRAYLNKELTTVKGETTIFIAAEFVESQYAYSQLARFHLRDLDRDGTETTLEVGEFERPAESDWITMQLDEHFCYGQNAAYKSGSNPHYRLNRWIVYHPRVAKEIPSPSMHQHRFTGAVSLNIAKTTISQATEFVPDLQKPIAAAIKAGSSLLLDLFRTNVGHKLHHFLTSDVANEAIKLGTASAASNGLDEKAAQLLALQFAEAEPPTKKDPKTGKALEAEIKQEDKFLKAFGKEWATTKWNITVDPGTEQFVMKYLKAQEEEEDDFDMFPLK